MPLAIDDYLADTRHLTTLEHGAYLLLIMRYWQKGGLPDDERMIARLSGLTPEQWAESREVLASFFEDGWRHKRIDGELNKAADIISKRKSAAERMHSQRGSKNDAHAEQVHSTCSDMRVPPSPLPETDISEPIGSSAAAPPEDPVARLFSDGLTDLMSLGVKEPQARRMLGKWRKDAGDDCGRVLAAIARARERCVSDPIPFVTATLSGGPDGQRNHSTQGYGRGRTSGTDQAFAHLADAVARRTGAGVPAQDPGGFRFDEPAAPDRGGNLIALGGPSGRG